MVVTFYMENISLSRFSADFNYSSSKKCKIKLPIKFIYMEVFLWVGFLQLNALQNQYQPLKEKRNITINATLITEVLKHKQHSGIITRNKNLMENMHSFTFLSPSSECITILAICLNWSIKIQGGLQFCNWINLLGRDSGCPQECYKYMLCRS